MSVFFQLCRIPFSQFWEQIVKSPKCLIALSYSLYGISFQVTLMKVNFKWILAESKAKTVAEYRRNEKHLFSLRLWNVQVWQTLATRHSNCAYNNLSKPRINDMMLYFLLPTFGITKYFFLSSVFFSRSWVKHFFTPFAAFGSLIWLCLMGNKPQNVIT